MTKQEVIISKDLKQDIADVVGRIEHDRLFVLTDTTTLELCWPVVSNLPCLESAQMITIGDTDDNKTLDSLVHVWTALQQGGASTKFSLRNLLKILISTIKKIRKTNLG